MIDVRFLTAPVYNHGRFVDARRRSLTRRRITRSQVSVEIFLGYENLGTGRVDGVPLECFAPDPHPVRGAVLRVATGGATGASRDFALHGSREPGAETEPRPAGQLLVAPPVARDEDGAVDTENDHGDAENPEQSVHADFECRHLVRYH